MTKLLKEFGYGIDIEYVIKDSCKYTFDGLVNMVVKFTHFPEELPFCANKDDIYEHGRWLYEQAVAGAFGSVAEYERPDVTEYDLQVELDKLMVDVQLGLATEDEISLAKNLRIQIKEFQAQAGA